MHLRPRCAPSPQRLVPGPGDVVTCQLLEPFGITLRPERPQPPPRFAVAQLWTNLPTLSAWGGGAEEWHAETAAPSSGNDFRIAVIPLATGARRRGGRRDTKGCASSGSGHDRCCGYHRAPSARVC